MNRPNHTTHLQHRSWRTLAVWLAAAAALAVGTTTPAVAGTPAAKPGSRTEAAPSTANQPQRAATVTLITGDRVTVDGNGRLQRIEPGAGRRNILFTTSSAGGELTVTPSDAVPLLQNRVVDPRLFNVSLLVAYGYDDAQLAHVPTIARGVDGNAGAAELVARGMAAPRELAAVRAFAGAVDKRRAGDFWAAVKQRGAGVQRGARLATRVWLDGKRQLLLDRSVAQVGGPVAWAAGYTGAGVTVAVLDTGIDLNHPDFAGRIRATANFTSTNINTTVQDSVGHGTHVASTIAGSGAGSAGAYRGVAPDVRLAIGKVCSDFGCTDSAILAGIQWAAATIRARVVNMSLGGPGSAAIDPLEEAIDTLSASMGTLFVVAAGNTGCRTAGTVQSPATADAALSVGAVDRAGQMASFSSCGPRAGDAGTKPEITGPGVGIVAARSSSSGLVATDPARYYTAYSGTSMATPHVAGAAALVAQQHPDWTGADIKALLVATAAPSNSASIWRQGAGLVNVAAAVQRSWFDSSGALNYGVQLWPHADDALLVKRITLRNSASQPVALSLGVQMVSTAGDVAPPGMAYLSATQLTLPAGGSAPVDVMVNTTVNAPDGIYGGTVVVSDGSVSTTTLLSVLKEPESYDLTLRHTGPTGLTSAPYQTLIDRLDAQQPQATAPASTTGDGTVVVRLQKGIYRVYSTFDSSTRSDTLVAPSVTVDRSLTLDVDARRTALWQFTVPDAATVPIVRYFDAASLRTPSGMLSIGGYVLGDTKALYFGRIDTAARALAENFAFNVGAEFARSDGFNGADANFPIFQVAESVRGQAPVGWRKDYALQDLAKLTTLLPAAPAGTLTVYGLRPELAGAGVLVFSTDTAPANGMPVHYVNASHGLRWSQSLTWQSRVTYEQLPQNSLAVAYAPGTETTADWTAPLPYSPALNPTYGVFDVGRTPEMVYNDPAFKLAPGLRRSAGGGQDTVLLFLQPFGDAAGNAGMPLANAANTMTLGLSRDGTALFQQDVTRFTSAVMTIPALGGNYTMTMDVGQATALAPLLGLPSRSTTVWKFASAPATSAAWTTLPLSVVRLGRMLRGADGVPRFTLQVQRQATGAPAPDAVSSLMVEVSGDAGTTWRKAVAVGGGSDWNVALPWRDLSSARLSVRSKAISADGASVEQTLIDVYPALPR